MSDLQAGGGYACPAGRRQASGAPLSARSHPAQVQILASGAPGVSRKRRHADPPLAASLATGLSAGFLCTSMWITCAKRHHACGKAGTTPVEMLGIAPSARLVKWLFNRQNTGPHPVHAEKTEIVHTPRRQAHNIDRIFIRS